VRSQLSPDSPVCKRQAGRAVYACPASTSTTDGEISPFGHTLASCPTLINHEGSRETFTLAARPIPINFSEVTGI